MTVTLQSLLLTGKKSPQQAFIPGCTSQAVKRMLESSSVSPAFQTA